MNYFELISHYEQCLENHGDCHRGVDWPKPDDALLRYKVMLQVIRETNEKISLLDFGCGAAHLYDYILNSEIKNVDYMGLDISEKFINLCREKHPSIQFYCQDVLSDGLILPAADYVVMNGVFTEKLSMSHDEMFKYFTLLLNKIFKSVKKGIAFNLMSKFVDWERDDLFHLSIDVVTNYITRDLGRNFVIRNDYGLYEYSVYVYRDSLLLRGA
jgi:SAM-dependent methyltransferase